MSSVLLVKNALCASTRLDSLVKRCGFDRIEQSVSLSSLPQRLTGVVPDLVIIDVPSQEQDAVHILEELSQRRQLPPVLLFVRAGQTVLLPEVFCVARPMRISLLLPQIARRFPQLTESCEGLRSAAWQKSWTDKAKALLMQQKGWDEQTAHHYLEKQAMDQRIRRWQAAQNIVEAIKKEGEQQ